LPPGVPLAAKERSISDGIESRSIRTPKIAWPSGRARWLVLAEQRRRRWGGDLRRAYIFRELALRTGAVVEGGWTRGALARALATAGIGRWGWPWSRRPALASAELLVADALPLLDRRARPVVLDVHDHPTLQRAALGVPTDPATTAALERRFAENVARFELLVVPSVSFGELVALDDARRIVAPNGTDTEHVRPGPFPDRPTVGLVSGAAPGRGIETLIEAMELVRASVPDAGLRLWLAAERDDPYLAALRVVSDRRPWIRIEQVPYERLPDALAEAVVLVVPHPPGDYMDAALPVKLFDSMAAGRPLVVTPRREMAALVERHHAGLVTEGDRLEDLAAAIVRLLDDLQFARRLGAAGRAAAESEYDWRVIGGRVADEVLRRVG